MNWIRAGTVVGAAIFAAAVSAADTTSQRFAQQAAADGIAEVELADLALERATSNEVKILANHIKQDHQQANDKLKSLAAQKGVTIAEQTDDKHKREKDRLAKFDGGEFDRAYVKTLINAHEQDIKAFEKQARSGKDAELKAFASDALPKLREHLDHAKQIQKELQAKK